MEMISFCSKLRHPLILLLLMIMALQCVSVKLHRVGGKRGWNPNINYTEWAASEHFYVNDWLIFYFDKNMYNVLEVNKTNYENCRDQEFMTNISRGSGRDVFELKEAKVYFFLSSGGFCWSGMKLAISVHQPPPPPPPSPPPASSKAASLLPPATASIIITTLLLTFSIVLDCQSKKTSEAKGSKEGDPIIASLEYDDYSDAL
ncbi:hypothetical protein Ddye_011957 [Dipteronia dyeriana]|uniref:Phytocyanin domain-containing protein n=1 Tax=Dipteronia dyeriana TaxID=168575 RepID=A0AAD9X3K4_9ROSI|nr:hypothetical protein Ddye_011957 [Dipteronia dyeriana]